VRAAAKSTVAGRVGVRYCGRFLLLAASPRCDCDCFRGVEGEFGWSCDDGEEGAPDVERM